MAIDAFKIMVTPITTDPTKANAQVTKIETILQAILGTLSFIQTRIVIAPLTSVAIATSVKVDYVAFQSEVGRAIGRLVQATNEGQLKSRTEITPDTI
jgi:uncharacterized membrane protein